jgi:beta-N-acetylglucosaminidase
MSWSSLDHNRKDLFAKIVEDEALLAIVITRLLRNKKVLKKIDAKAKRKTQCLLSSMKESNIFESFVYLIANALVESSSTFWSSLAMLDDFSNVDGIAE